MIKLELHKGLYDLYSFIEKYLILRKELDTLLEVYNRILKIIGIKVTEIEVLEKGIEYYMSQEEIEDYAKNLIVLSITLSSNYDELININYLNLIHERSNLVEGYDYIFARFYKELERRIYKILSYKIEENCMPAYNIDYRTRIHNILLNETLSDMKTFDYIRRYLIDFLDKNILYNLQSIHDNRVSFYVFHNILLETYKSIMHLIQEGRSEESTDIMDTDFTISSKDVINVFIRSKINDFLNMDICKKMKFASAYDVGYLLYSLSEIKTMTKIMYFIRNVNSPNFECRLYINIDNCNYPLSHILISKLIGDFLEDPNSLLSIFTKRSSTIYYKILNEILHSIKSNKEFQEKIKNIILSIKYSNDDDYKRQVFKKINRHEILNTLEESINKNEDYKQYLGIFKEIIYRTVEPISFTLHKMGDLDKCLDIENLVENILEDVTLFPFIAYTNIEGIPAIGSFNKIKTYTLKCSTISNSEKLEELTMDAIMSFDNTLFLVEESIGEKYIGKIGQIIKNYKKILPPEEERKWEEDTQSNIITAPNVTIIPMIILTDNTINQVIENFDDVKEAIQELGTNENMTIIIANQLLTKHIKIIIDFGDIRLEQDKKDKILTPLETIKEIIEYNPSKEYSLP